MSECMHLRKAVLALSDTALLFPWGARVRTNARNSLALCTAAAVVDAHLNSMCRLVLHRAVQDHEHLQAQGAYALHYLQYVPRERPPRRLASD